MFSCIGADCKSTCVGADPITDTIKFVPDAADIQQQELQRAEMQEAERQERSRLEEERKRVEAAEHQRQLEKAVREREEKERREQQELARLAQEHEEKRQQEEAARIQADKRERARLEAEQRACQEEAAARQQLEAWLKKNSYSGVNTKKKKMMMARYPLHDAVTQRDATTVRLLLRFGADKGLKNSSGRTAHELAKHKSNRSGRSAACEEVLGVFASQSQVQRGGA